MGCFCVVFDLMWRKRHSLSSDMRSVSSEYDAALVKNVDVTISDRHQCIVNDFCAV